MVESTPSIRLLLLGPVELRVARGTEARGVLTQPKRLALLVYLALCPPGAFLRRDHILTLFWPDLDQERARAALRDSLYHVRRVIGADAIETRGSEEVRANPVLVSTDVSDFIAAAGRGDNSTAATLYRADLLHGFHLAGAPAFDEWLETERTRLRALAHTVLSSLAESALAAGDDATAAAWYRHALDTSPFDEALVFGLMEALEQSGSASDALLETNRFAARLEKDLGVQPTATFGRRVALLKERMHATSAVRAYRTAPNPPAASGSLETATAPAHITAPAIVRALPRRHWRRTAALASVLVVVAAIAAARFGLNPAPRAGPTQQIVITPFTVHGDQRIEYLREGMVDLLAAKFDGAPGIHVIDPKAMLENLPRPRDVNALDVGRGLARRFGAQHFITGTVVQGGEALQISATLYDARGAVLARSDRVAANESFLFAAIDDLARELLAGLLKKSEAPLAQLAALTTSSYPAVQKYLQGEQHFRAGAYVEAVTAFQGAIAQDSMFALAHYRLSSAADWAGKVEIAEQAARTAMHLRERLPKEPAALVYARWEYWFNDAARADEIYRELTAVRPTDIEAWFEQGEVAFHAGPWMGKSMTDAEPAFRRVLALDSAHIGAMMHLARVAALGHRVGTLDTLLRKASQIDPHHERTLEIRALRAGAMNDVKTMDSVIQRLTFFDNGNAINADAERVAVYTGNLGFAERIARLGAGAGRAKPERMIGLQSLAHLLAGQSRWTEAKQQIEILAGLDAAIASQLRANLTALPFVHASPADVARAQTDLIAHPPVAANETQGNGSAGGPHHFERAWYDYQLGMLAAIARDPKADDYVALLRRKNPADSTSDVNAFRRSLAGSLDAHIRAVKGDSAGALRVLEESWMPARKPLMIGWAWTHANATDRLFRATLLAQAGRNQDALRWCAAVREDIAGSPVLLVEAERVIQRANGMLRRASQP